MNNLDDAPYPLKRRFQRIVLPGLLLLTVIIGITVGQGSTRLTQKIYLELSEKRSTIIDRALTAKNAAAWKALQETTDPEKFYATPEGDDLMLAMRDEVMELGLAHLKIYGKSGLVLFSTEKNKIGTVDPSQGYRDAINGVRSLIEKIRPDGLRLYELYVQVPGSFYGTVMELYEPINYLDELTLKIVIPAILFPVFVLLVLGLSMYKLVSFAQDDMNYRADLLSEFRQRLQQLVSDEAVDTLRKSTGQGKVTSRRIQATILFSDVRRFTEFCENETPENVVSFLNTSLGIVIDAVHDNGGDVDKMIGDAVLAHFQGDKAESRACTAAIEAMEKMHQAGLPRGIGIGIYTGEVVVGVVGASNRMDFTIIGDAVNTASRLCSAANQGQIIIDDKTYSTTDTETLPIENIIIKGKTDPIPVVKIERPKP